MPITHKSPQQLQTERYAQNPNEALRVDFAGGWVYPVMKVTSKIDSIQFGMTSKKIRKQR